MTAADITAYVYTRAHLAAAVRELEAAKVSFSSAFPTDRPDDAPPALLLEDAIRYIQRFDAGCERRFNQQGCDDGR